MGESRRLVVRRFVIELGYDGEPERMVTGTLTYNGEAWEISGEVPMYPRVVTMMHDMHGYLKATSLK